MNPRNYLKAGREAFLRWARRWRRALRKRVVVWANARCPRPMMTWRRVEDASIRAFYDFYDERSLDVVAKHNHAAPCAPCQPDGEMSYTVVEQEERLHFLSCPQPGTWIYLSSKKAMPVNYALEFDYVPHNVFEEQLQLDFAGDDLANRHRFMIFRNEAFQYQIFCSGQVIRIVDDQRLSVPLHEVARIRLEVVGDTFAFCVNGELVACWRNRLWRPRETVGKIIFWNGPCPDSMDFEIGNFALYQGAEAE